MTDKQYNEIPAVRRSALWEIRKSPMHYKYAVEHPEEPTEALRFGIAAHKFILEPETFFDEFVTVPKIDRRTKAGKEEWAELLASGKEFVTESDMDTIPGQWTQRLWHILRRMHCSRPDGMRLRSSGLKEPRESRANAGRTA